MAASATATLLSFSSSQNQHASSLPTTFSVVPQCQRLFFVKRKKPPQRFVAVAVTQESEEKVPSWAKPDSDEPPPWARDEGSNKTSSSSSGFEIPFYGYLLASAITAIAAVGSIFEYVNQKPVFGFIPSDSVFYAPLLGFFAFTGIPSSVFLWFKSVQAANKEAEEQDKRDGYL